MSQGQVHWPKTVTRASERAVRGDWSCISHSYQLYWDPTDDITWISVESMVITPPVC
jgi:hypothetical protein